MIKVGLTDNKEDDSEETSCDEREKTSFQHFKKNGSKRVNVIPVSSVINKSKY